MDLEEQTRVRKKARKDEFLTKEKGSSEGQTTKQVWLKLQTTTSDKAQARGSKSIMYMKAIRKERKKKREKQAARHIHHNKDERQR